MSELRKDESSAALPRFSHKGTITLSTGVIRWKEKAGGEIGFERDGDIDDVDFKTLKLDEADQLRLVNGLLAYYRPYAMPNGGKYYAASIGISRDGKLYISTNNELAITDEFAGRGCAETTMLSSAQKEGRNSDIMFDYVYLMSGKAKRNLVTKKLEEVEPGHVGCLCGECRRNLRDHTDERTKFTMLPTNDGEVELTINRTAKSNADLNPNEAWEIDYHTMYPVPKYKALGAQSSEVVKNGYLYITGLSPTLPMTSSIPAISDEDRAAGRISLSIHDAEKLLKHFHTADTTIPALNENPSLENINRYLTSMIKDTYAEHRGVENLVISVVVVKANDGRFYGGLRVDGDKIPAKPNAAINSLALNKKGVQEVYMMTFDEKQLLDEMHHAHGGSTQGHQCPVADPADLGRILKNCLPTDNPSITMIPLNDGSLDENALRSLSPPMNLREMFGPDFANPKRDGLCVGGCGPH